MKQLKNLRTQTTPFKPLAIMLLAALPLVASASGVGAFDTAALIAQSPPAPAFDWPRFSLLAAGVIALVCARVGSSKSNNF